MMTTIIICVLSLSLFALVRSHGLLSYPPQRGCTNGNQYAKIPIYDRKATIDYSAHFPAGNKALFEGAGLYSQMRAAGRRGWVPYEPWRKNFRWRAGVCGDTTWGRQHLRGGKYYNGGKVTASYPVNGVISLDVTVTAHHNGFFEFWVCDIARCGGEISPKCFQNGMCHQLKRVYDASCESRNDWKCAPIDRKYPARWYLPCTRGKGKIDYYGKGKIKYHLPKNLRCKHCVLQWYWASGNSCNPPGLVSYFKSPRHPKWGQCWGQGDAKGGWRRWEAMCRGRRFSEEYLQCADISIGGGGYKAPAKGGGKILPPGKKPDWWGRNRGPMAKLIVYNFGKPVYTVYQGQRAWIKLGRRYNQISMVMITLGKTYRVHFYRNDRKWHSGVSETAVRYNGGKRSFWTRPWYGTWFKLSAVTAGKGWDCRIFLQR